MTDRKKYLINRKEFYIKESLTARDKLNNKELFGKMKINGDTFSVEECTREEVNRLLKTILEPVDKCPVEDEDFFSDITEDVELEVFGSFFLERLKKINTTQKFLTGLMTDTVKSLDN